MSDYLGLDNDYFIVDFHTTEDLVDKTIGEVINGEPVEALVVKRMKEAPPTRTTPGRSEKATGSSSVVHSKT